MSQTFTLADVQTHNKPDNLWIVVDGDVYDLTKFGDEHPGMTCSDQSVKHHGINTDQGCRRKEEYVPASLLSTVLVDLCRTADEVTYRS